MANIKQTIKKSVRDCDYYNLGKTNENEDIRIELHPVKLFDFEMFETFQQVMCLPKDYIYDKQIMKMSYLKFLLAVLQKVYSNEYDFKQLVENFLSYITREDCHVVEVVDDIQDKDIIFHYEIYVGDIILTETDFENIRKIVLEQNGSSLEFIESFNPQLQESLDFFNRNSVSPEILEKIDIYTVISKVDESQMQEWTRAEFERKYTKLGIYENWKIFQPLVSSGQIELKGSNKILDPFDQVKVPKDRYEAILISKEQMMSENAIFKDVAEQQ